MSNSYIVELERLRAELVEILQAKGKTVDNNAPLQTAIPLVRSVGVSDGLKELLQQNQDYEIVDNEETITTINVSAMSGSYLTNISVPALTFLCNDGLKNTSRLQTAYLGTNSAGCIIGSWGLYGSAVQEIYGGIITSNDTCFGNCSNLVKAIFQSLYLGSVTTFGNDSALKIVDFGTVDTIPNRNNTFNNCSSVKAIILRKTEAITTLGGTATLTYLLNNVTGWHIYVPDSLVDSYKAATNWATYASYFKPLSEYDEDAILNS